MDRTNSELPTEILHQILSRLSAKDAARTTVLSKIWLNAWSTNPHLNFDEGDFMKKPFYFGGGKTAYISPFPYHWVCCCCCCDFMKKHGEFLEYVDNTLERYRYEDLPISAVKLCISLYDEAIRDAMYKWVNIIAEKRASHFEISHSEEGYYSQSYNLPDTILSIESLQSLELNKCKIPTQGAPFEDKIKCRNLKSLSLCRVTLSESALYSLISCCPQIIMVSLNYCRVKQARIADSPRLNIGTCLNLKKVEFANVSMDDTFLFKLISNLPFIKALILRHCDYLKNLKISSSTLEFLTIYSCEDMMQAIFDVPKLLSLELSGFSMKPSLSFEGVSSQCRISLDFLSRFGWDAQRLIGLRRSLIESNQFIDLAFSRVYFRELSAISVRESEVIGSIDHHHTPEVENLILFKNFSSILSYSTFFDALFWTCSPKRLTIHCDKDFIRKCLHQLVQKRSWGKIKYCKWKEYLMNSQIEYMNKKENGWATVDWNILRANCCIIEEINIIRFTPT